MSFGLLEKEYNTLLYAVLSPFLSPSPWWISALSGQHNCTIPLTDFYLSPFDDNFVKGCGPLIVSFCSNKLEPEKWINGKWKIKNKNLRANPIISTSFYELCTIFLFLFWVILLKGSSLVCEGCLIILTFQSHPFGFWWIPDMSFTMLWLFTIDLLLWFISFSFLASSL